MDLATCCRAIRAECNRQGIDDATRREIMAAKAGVLSQKDLDIAGAKAVLDHLRAASNVKPNEWSFVDKAPQQKRQRLRYIIVLVGKLGIQRGSQKRYVEGIAENMDGTIREFKAGKLTGERPTAVRRPLELCSADELGRIVNALEIHVKRRSGGKADSHE